MILQLNAKKLKEVLRKSVAINSRPNEESFPELPTVLIWMRFCLAVAYGTYIGRRGVKAGAMVLQALNLVAFLPFMYCRLFLGTDAEAYGTQIIFSGTLQAVALAVLIWIYFYTAQMEEQELRLADLLIAPSGDAVGGEHDQIVVETIALPVVEEDEF